MRVEPLGDSAYILRDLDAPAYLVANWLNLKRPSWLVEAVASYDTVGLYTTYDFDPTKLEMPGNYAAIEPRTHKIPVCYEMGEDLENTSKLLGLTPRQLADCHA